MLEVFRQEFELIVALINPFVDSRSRFHCPNLNCLGVSAHFLSNLCDSCMLRNRQPMCTVYSAYMRMVHIANVFPLANV